MSSSEWNLATTTWTEAEDIHLEDILVLLVECYDLLDCFEDHECLSERILCAYDNKDLTTASVAENRLTLVCLQTTKQLLLIRYRIKYKREPY